MIDGEAITVAALAFRPMVPLWLLAAATVVVLIAVALALLGRLPAAGWRLPPLILLLAFLAQPVVSREEREPLADQVLVALDRTPSMAASDRTGTVDETHAALLADLEARPDLRVETVEIGGDDNGSPVVQSLDEAMAGLDRRRLAGTIVITDGQAHDMRETAPGWSEQRPVHVLLAGEPDESDRRLVLEELPSYAMVGEPLSFSFRLEDDLDPSPQPVTIYQNGEVVYETTATPDASTTVPLELERAGQTVLEIEVPVRDGEISETNNRVVAFVNGVRDRLRVLLISGKPYPGLRVWRNLLKADPAVDLVHFTILRPPEKQDGTPVRELALIAFPVRELFEVKLQEFDLVVFDNYERRGLLPLAYLDNVATYVEQGGGLLIAAGPSFATPLSIARTPLDRVIPMRPSGELYERPFMPRVTELGDRHPVTAGLEADWGGDGWGRWFRMVDVESGDGQTLMEGFADRPLLTLGRIGEGRVAQLLSDHAWLWARGYEGGGPQALLLRRLVHWLMQEPELEEERLVARPVGDSLIVERQTLDMTPSTVTMTQPDGTTVELTLEPAAEGRLRAEIRAADAGLFRFDDGERQAFAAVRPMAPLEVGDLRATDAVLAPLAAAGGGAMAWLGATGLPDIRTVAEDRARSGRGWIGLVRNGEARILGRTETPLAPAWLALLLLLSSQIWAWWREGRS